MIKYFLTWLSGELALSRDFKLNRKKCFNCEHLQELLEHERAERVKLVNKLVDKDTIKDIVPKEIKDDEEWIALQNNARSRITRAMLSRQSFIRNEQNKKEFEESKLKENA